MDDQAAGDRITGQVGDGAGAVAIGKQITQINAQTVYVQGEVAVPAAPSDWDEAEARYRTQIVTHYNKLPLTGLPERDSNLHEITLERIFVKLAVQLPQPARQYFVELEESSAPTDELTADETQFIPDQRLREDARRERRCPTLPTPHQRR
jgi:hypothetical protein